MDQDRLKKQQEQAAAVLYQQLQQQQQLFQLINRYLIGQNDTLSFVENGIGTKQSGATYQIKV